MPSWKDLYPDKWLRASTIGHNRVRVTIDRVRQESLFNPTTKKHENKITIAFRGKELRLIANKTQLEAITKIAGTDDYTHWSGCSVMLSTAVANNGKDTIVITPTSGAASTPAPAQAGGQPRFEEETFERPRASSPAPDEDDDDLWDTSGEQSADSDARPAPSAARPAATPGNSDARPVNNADGPCPECHAPMGKPHATACTAARPDTMHGQGETPKNPDARPAPAPENAGTRPEAHQAELIYGGQIYADVARISQDVADLPKYVTELIRKARNAEKDSSAKMSLTYYRSLIALLISTFHLDPDEEAELLLTALIGRQINIDARPGQLVHGYLIKPLREQDETFIGNMNELLFCCRDIIMANLEAG